MNLRRFLRETKTFFTRSVKESFRDKIVLFWDFVWPLFWYFLTIYIMSAPWAEAETLPYLKATVAVSMGVFGTITATLVGFSTYLGSDLEEGRYAKLRSLPVSPFSNFLGNCLGGFVIGISSFIIVLVVSLVDGANLGFRSIVAAPVVLLVLILLCLLCVSLAVLIVTAVKNPRYVSTVSLTILMILFFITGYNGMQPYLWPAENREILNFLPNSLAGRMGIWFLTDWSETQFENIGIAVPKLPMPHSPTFIMLMLLYASAFVTLGFFLMKKIIYKR
jgi:ABC-2 type transport system permease protein